MAQKIKIRRGLKKDLPLLEVSELGFCTDTAELYIGTTSGNALLGGNSAGKTTITKGSNGTINVDGFEIKVFDDEQIKSLINSKVDISALNYKANVTDLDNAISAVNANLFGKVNKTEVDSLLANKVEKSYVDNAIANVQTIKGDTGLQGERGLQGIQGAKGEKGDSGATTLSSLTDVVISNANEGDVLSLSEGKWVPKTITIGNSSSIPSDSRFLIIDGELVYEYTSGSSYDFSINSNGELVVTY